MSETPEEAIAVMRQASEVVSKVLPSALAELVCDALLTNIDAVLHGSTPQLQWVAREVLALAEQQAQPVRTGPNTAVAVIAEAFNTAHIPTPDFPDLAEVNRHDGHRYSGSCYVCRGDVATLVPHIADALAEAGLLRVPVDAGFGPPAAALRQLADLCDAGEIDDFMLTRALSVDVWGGGWISEYRVANPAHPVTRIEIHHKPEAEGAEQP